MSEREELIDRLIHDAEHAEAGAMFARMMAKSDPSNEDHVNAAKRLAEKAAALRRHASDLRKESDHA